MMTKTALICGISGQDGAYLAKFLLQNYIVWGTCRDAQISRFSNLDILGIKEQVNLISMVLTDFRSVLQVITRVNPDEIYNLAGQTSVGFSFEQPVETLESIAMGTLNLLEAVRFLNKTIKIYNAGSSECFGDVGNVAADEETPFRPRSPYAVAKSAAFWQVANYREAYGLFACSGILFNHESPLRSERFVTQKIISTACRISQGSSEKLHLGNIKICRDWGWAEEYVRAMHLMLQQDLPDDYIVATGKTCSLEDFVRFSFEYFNLDWEKSIVIDETLFRPTDLTFSRANTTKARTKLGWEAKYETKDIVKMMIESKLKGATH